MVYRRCDDTTVEGAALDLTNLPATGQTEHPIDVSRRSSRNQAFNVRLTLPSSVYNSGSLKVPTEVGFHQVD